MHQNARNANYKQVFQLITRMLRARSLKLPVRCSLTDWEPVNKGKVKLVLLLSTRVLADRRAKIVPLRWCIILTPTAERKIISFDKKKFFFERE